MRFGADFSALVDRFSPNPKDPVALAVSGGSDSLGLLDLCQDWAARSARELLVFTVDHGLRPEAANEAETVAMRCRRLGIGHQILRWAEPKPTQSAARVARYRLLANAAQQVGARCLLTGHTFDDVVETAIIRRRRGVRGSIVAGPALAAPLPIWPEGRGLTLLRPLTSATRTALRAHLVSSGIDWIDDPSNENLSFERVRVRKFLKRHPKLAEQASRQVARLQKSRATADADFSRALAQVCVQPSGLIDTKAAPLSSRLLSVLARCAGGQAKDPRGGAVRDLMASLTEPGQRQTLGGAWFQRSHSGFLVGRDPAKTPEQDTEDVFDGRFAKDSEAMLPEQDAAPFLVRHALPRRQGWREVISERISHIQHCHQTPFYDCLLE